MKDELILFLILGALYMAGRKRAAVEIGEVTVVDWNAK
jgi:hypothetical protein